MYVCQRNIIKKNTCLNNIVVFADNPFVLSLGRDTPIQILFRIPAWPLFEASKARQKPKILMPFPSKK